MDVNDVGAGYRGGMGGWWLIQTTWIGWVDVDRKAGERLVGQDQKMMIDVMGVDGVFDRNPCPSVESVGYRFSIVKDVHLIISIEIITVRGFGGDLH
jgi:hypothetical protein